MDVYSLLRKSLRTYVARNLVRGLGNVVLRRFPGAIKPRWIWFGVTDKCNSHCVHCDIWRKKSTADPLTPAEIERMWEDPIFQNVECILTSGGEPVLRDDLEEILLIQHKVLPRAEVHLSTNALLPERVISVVKTLAEKNIPLSVGISLDGIGSKHDTIRGREGNFEKADRLIRELAMMHDKLHYKVYPGIGLTLSDLTLDSCSEVRGYAEKLGIPFRVQWLNQSAFYENTGKKLVDKAAGKQKMLEILRSLPLDLVNEKWMGWLNDQSIQFPCYAMHSFFVLRCNGDVVPCLSHWDVKAGNVRESTPTQIWRSIAASKARKTVARCEGCLNSWGVQWSANTCVYPLLFFYLRHRDEVLKKLAEKTG